MKRIVASCDHIDEHGETLVEGREVVLRIDRLEGALDFCPECRKALVEPLEALLEAFGQPVNAAPAKAPKHRPRAAQPDGEGSPASALDTGLTCPTCGHLAGSRKNLSTHARQAHGQSLSVLLGEPIAGTCEVCGLGFGTGAGLALHRLRVHDLRGGLPS